MWLTTCSRSRPCFQPLTWINKHRPGKQTQGTFKGTVSILREQCPITMPPFPPLNPAGMPCSNALRLSCQFSQRFVCCFSVHFILSSPFPTARSHGCSSWDWPGLWFSLWGWDLWGRLSHRGSLLLQYSQVPIFFMPWLLKSSELWCLGAEEGNDQWIQQAPVSHLGCRSTSEHLGDWKGCSVHAQANLNVALIRNLQSPRPSPTLLVLWRHFCFSNTSPSTCDPHYDLTMTGRQLRHQLTPAPLKA